MAQLTYGYTTSKGTAGSLLDTGYHNVASRANGEATADTLKFGMGVTQGSTPGVNVQVPVSGDTADKFEGITVSGVTEMDMEGNVKITPYATVGVMTWGKIWARVETGLTIAYGDPVYLINSGTNAGMFTNVSGGIAIKGRFISAADNANIAPIELFNQAQS